MNINKKRLFRWIQFSLLIYASVGIALYYLQNKILLHPCKLPQDYIFKFKESFKEVLIPINKEDTIHLVQFFTASVKSKGLVLYFHGNQKNVEHYASCATTFLKNGYEVWMPDYPGFGKSSGKLTESKLYEQAYQIKRWAEKKYSADSIVIYGKDFGAGVAANLAENASIKALVLENPYYSITDLFHHYACIYPVKQMAEFKFPVNEFLPNVSSGIVLIEKTNRQFFSYKGAQKLKPLLKANDRFISIEGNNQDDISNSELYIHAIDSLLR